MQDWQKVSSTKAVNRWYTPKVLAKIERELSRTAMLPTFTRVLSHGIRNIERMSLHRRILVQLQKDLSVFRLMCRQFPACHPEHELTSLCRCGSASQSCSSRAKGGRQPVTRPGSSSSRLSANTTRCCVRRCVLLRSWTPCTPWPQCPPMPGELLQLFLRDVVSNSGQICSASLPILGVHLVCWLWQA